MLRTAPKKVRQPFITIAQWRSGLLPVRAHHLSIAFRPLSMFNGSKVARVARRRSSTAKFHVYPWS